MTFIPHEIPREDPGTHQRVWGAWVGSQGYEADVTVRQHAFMEPAAWMIFHFDPEGDDDSLSAANFAAAVNVNLRQYGWSVENVFIAKASKHRMRQLADQAQALV